MNRKPWTPEQVALLRELYPCNETSTIVERVGHPVVSCYAMARKLGIPKDPAWRLELLKTGARAMAKKSPGNRYQRNHTAWNAGMKGLRIPGSEKGWIKKGEPSRRWDAERYAPGALRVNCDGYIDMKVSDRYDRGRHWQALHRILWQDAFGPIPPGHCLWFKDGDKLNVCLENLECITRAEMIRRVDRAYPPELKAAIQLLGQFKRRLREQKDRRSA